MTRGTCKTFTIAGNYDGGRPNWQKWLVRMGYDSLSAERQRAHENRNVVKIIVDDKIPYIRGVLEPYAEVVYLPGKQTGRDAVRDADALVTRTRTICSRQVLEGSKVKFIATATIGFDHIDTGYCASAGIGWTSAPGCNAESVNQYIASALFTYSRRHGFELKSRTIGIVGVGQVGSRVAKTCEILGMNVLLNDPPRARREGPAQFVSLEEIQQKADIVTFHVPLDMQGIDRTYYMADAGFLRGLKKRALLINTCRGEVFDTGAVQDAKKSAALAGLVIDCWENEPDLAPGFLQLVDLATPHIAGYSRDGKANGTRVSVRAVSRFFKLGIDDWEPAAIEAPARRLIELSGHGKSMEQVLGDAVLASYDIESDDRALRGDPGSFERLRGDYPIRREFAFYSVRAGDIGPVAAGSLEKLGFRVL